MARNFDRQPMKNVLICGGAGYIGSHMAHWLSDHGHNLTVLDNLSTGHAQAVHWGEFIHADLLDPAALDQALKGRRFDAVMHFCARSLVGESVRQPNAYYRNNVTGTINLLEAGEGCDLDYCANTARDLNIKLALSNSFGFGGTNGTLAIARV